MNLHPPMRVSLEFSLTILLSGYARNGETFAQHSDRGTYVITWREEEEEEGGGEEEEEEEKEESLQTQLSREQNATYYELN